MLVPAITHHSSKSEAETFMFPEGATKLYRTSHTCRRDNNKEIVVVAGQKEEVYKEKVSCGFWVLVRS